MIYEFFDEKSSGGGIKNENLSNQNQLKNYTKQL